MYTENHRKLIGEQLRHFRLQAGLETIDVAALLSTPHSRYVKIESGEMFKKESEEFQIDELVFLCRHYGISTDTFLGNELNIDCLTKEQKDIIENFLKQPTNPYYVEFFSHETGDSGS